MAPCSTIQPLSKLSNKLAIWILVCLSWNWDRDKFKKDTNLSQKRFSIFHFSHPLVFLYLLSGREGRGQNSSEGPLVCLSTAKFHFWCNFTFLFTLQILFIWNNRNESFLLQHKYVHFCKFICMYHQPNVTNTILIFVLVLVSNVCLLHCWYYFYWW